MNYSNQPTVLITPLKPALIAGTAHRLPVLVRVQAPDPDESQRRERRPYHLALVIDRSGSMAGEPLAEAVRCARHIVSRLEPTDRAALVVFDDGVDTLVPAHPGRRPRRAVRRARARSRRAAPPTSTAAGRPASRHSLPLRRTPPSPA